MSEELPTIAKAKVWKPSGLIEEAIVPDQDILQTDEFNRENPGDLERQELVQREKVNEIADQVDFFLNEITTALSEKGETELAVELQNARKRLRDLRDEEADNQ